VVLTRRVRQVLLTGALVLVILPAVVTCGVSSGPAEDDPASLPGARPTDSTGLIWTGDVETGDLSQFKDAPWNTAGGAFSPVVESDLAYVRDGRYSLRFTIPAEVDPSNGICCGARSELEPAMGDIRSGDDLWFAFSTLLGEGFPVDSTWQIITQWKQNDAGSPPLELSVGEGNYSLSGGYGHPRTSQPFSQPLGPAVPGEWVDWLVHVEFDTDPASGSVEVWQDGQQVLSDYHPAAGTMYPVAADNTIYMKTGYYRDLDIRQRGTLFVDSWRIGVSREAVTRSG
jgi:hypothetical protein